MVEICSFVYFNADVKDDNINKTKKNTVKFDYTREEEE